ncbi:MAG: metallophosphoesterase family protein [Actinomycetota bacterium]
MQTREQKALVTEPPVRHKRRRRVWLSIAVSLALVAGVLAYLYGPQAVSMLTHRKGAPTKTEPVAPFAPDARPTLRIAAVGDVGEGEEEEWQTAYSMHMLESGNPPYNVLLLLGDNVYPSGDPSRLDATVFHPFGILLENGTRLLAILGNHDGARGLEQIHDLGMPNRWWATTIDDVLLIGLDSNSLADPDQLTFLRDTLSAATERWRIVAIHESPYSAGYQGSNITVRDDYAPLFARYGVQLVLSGHDHDYQRSTPIDGVTYVITGAGGLTRGTGEEWFTAASWSVLSYVDLNVFPDHLLIRAIDQDARMFDQVRIGVSGG